MYEIGQLVRASDNRVYTILHNEKQPDSDDIIVHALPWEQNDPQYSTPVMFFPEYFRMFGPLKPVDDPHNRGCDHIGSRTGFVGMAAGRWCCYDCGEYL